MSGRRSTPIRWLTGFDDDALARHLAENTTFEEFFAASDLNANASLITGVVCGVRVQGVRPRCRTSRVR